MFTHVYGVSLGALTVLWERSCVPQSFLSDMASLLGSADDLLAMVLKELEEWKRRQQVSCIGAPEDTNLEPLEKWYNSTTLIINLARIWSRALLEQNKPLCKRRLLNNLDNFWQSHWTAPALKTDQSETTLVVMFDIYFLLKIFWVLF